MKTAADDDSDTVAVSIDSELVATGELSVFFDFPYASGKNKFDAPYVGVWNATANHTTTLVSSQNDAAINHTLDATTYQTYIAVARCFWLMCHCALPSMAVASGLERQNDPYRRV